MTSSTLDGVYRFLYFDHRGQETTIQIDADTDDDAMRFARRRQYGLRVEVWQDRRFVAGFPAKDIAVGMLPDGV